MVLRSVGKTSPLFALLLAICCTGSACDGSGSTNATQDQDREVDRSRGHGVPPAAVESPSILAPFQREIEALVTVKTLSLTYGTEFLYSFSGKKDDLSEDALAVAESKDLAEIELIEHIASFLDSWSSEIPPKLPKVLEFGTTNEYRDVETTFGRTPMERFKSGASDPFYGADYRLVLNAQPGQTADAMAFLRDHLETQDRLLKEISAIEKRTGAEIVFKGSTEFEIGSALETMQALNRVARSTPDFLTRKYVVDDVWQGNGVVHDEMDLGIFRIKPWDATLDTFQTNIVDYGNLVRREQLERKGIVFELGSDDLLNQLVVYHLHRFLVKASNAPAGKLDISIKVSELAGLPTPNYRVGPGADPAPDLPLAEVRMGKRQTETPMLHETLLKRGDLAYTHGDLGSDWIYLREKTPPCQNGEVHLDQAADLLARWILTELTKQ